MSVEALQGTWQLLSSETEGERMEEEVVRQIRVIFSREHYAVYHGENSIVEDVAYTVDTAAVPHRSDDSLGFASIYELTGDLMRSCVAPRGKERPTAFSGAPGTGWSFRVFRRVDESRRE